MRDIHGTRDELVAMIVLRSEETRVANAVAKMERDCSAANRAENKRLRAALKPFADRNPDRRAWVTPMPCNDALVNDNTTNGLTFGDFRRAAAALEQKAGER